MNFIIIQWYVWTNGSEQAKAGRPVKRLFQKYTRDMRVVFAKVVVVDVR